MTKLGYRRTLGAGMAVLGIPLVLSALSYASVSQPKPFLAAPKPETRCILEAPTMRYQHMSYLKERRDRVVRLGEHSLRADSAHRGMDSCHNCHADRTQFCDRCHERAGVQLDCFGCHRY